MKKYRPEELIIVTLALGGGNFGILANQGMSFAECDFRYGKMIDMWFELQDRKEEGDFADARDCFPEKKSQMIFDFVTEGLSKGMVWCRSIFEPNSNFGNDVIQGMRDKEAFVDVGAYHGDVVERVVNSNRNYAWIKAFEPDPRVIEKLRARFSDPRIEIVAAAVSEKSGFVHFDSETTCGVITATEEAGTSSVPAVSLDESDISGVSFIKIDVEGAELAVLRGAKESISRNRPRLAISAYHRVNDLFELPKLLLSYCPDYRLFLRHHTVFTTGTILYAL